MRRSSPPRVPLQKGWPQSRVDGLFKNMERHVHQTLPPLVNNPGLSLQGFLDDYLYMMLTSGQIRDLCKMMNVS